MRWAAAVLMALLPSAAAWADATPTKWEQLFFPFPIVGAPPQLEQQVQLFATGFTGDRGSGFQPSAELAWIAASHWGLVADVPYQFGSGGQAEGIGDTTLLVQYLAAGSIPKDDMLSVGVQTSINTGVAGFTQGDTLIGPFAYAAKRFFHRLILEGNLTQLTPVEHAQTAKQLSADGLISFLTTPLSSSFPVYVQGELDSTRYFPAQTVFAAPELFIGPFKSPISDGTRLAAGTFFELAGDPEHHRLYSLTVSFDIPDRFGY